MTPTTEPDPCNCLTSKDLPESPKFKFIPITARNGAETVGILRLRRNAFPSYIVWNGTVYLHSLRPCHCGGEIYEYAANVRFAQPDDVWTGDPHEMPADFVAGEPNPAYPAPEYPAPEPYPVPLPKH